jgi:hypothetical protein
MRIVFVGVHNKENFTPLDSGSRTGMLVDRCIIFLQTELDLSGTEFLKTNLFDSLVMPHLANRDGTEAKAWAQRIGYKPDDIVICLGAIVHQYFRRSGIKFIAVGHPSGVWSKKKQENYIINVGIKVNEIIRSITPYCN